MFFVINKQKIYSYLIASSMVMILLLGSIFFTSKNQNTMETWYETNSNNMVNNANNANNVNNVNNVNNTKKANNTNNVNTTNTTYKGEYYKY